MWEKMFSCPMFILLLFPTPTLTTINPHFHTWIEKGVELLLGLEEWSHAVFRILAVTSDASEYSTLMIADQIARCLLHVLKCTCF
jgi:hypothetical protein